MIGGIAAIRTTDPEQIDRILALALDGLRYQAGRAPERQAVGAPSLRRAVFVEASDLLDGVDLAAGG